MILEILRDMTYFENLFKSFKASRVHGHMKTFYRSSTHVTALFKTVFCNEMGNKLEPHNSQGILMEFRCKLFKKSMEVRFIHICSLCFRWKSMAINGTSWLHTTFSGEIARSELPMFHTKRSATRSVAMSTVVMYVLPCDQQVVENVSSKISEHCWFLSNFCIGNPKLYKQCDK